MSATGSGFQAASGHTQGGICLKSSTRWLSSGNPDQSNVHLDTSDRHAVGVHDRQRCVAPVKSIGNGNTMVELRSLAMSNNVAR